MRFSVIVSRSCFAERCHRVYDPTPTSRESGKCVFQRAAVAGGDVDRAVGRRFAGPGHRQPRRTVRLPAAVPRAQLHRAHRAVRHAGQVLRTRQTRSARQPWIPK